MTRDKTWKVGKVSRFRLDGHTGTAFHKSTAALTTTNWYFNWDLRMVPDEYVDYSEELKAIRTNVAMGDMSPLTKCVVSGRDAAGAVDFLVTRDTRKLEVGQVVFTPWCTPDGKVVTDGLVFREAEDRYRITSDPTVEWLVESFTGMDVEVQDVTDSVGILTLQGPRSRDVLEAATGSDWSAMGFSRLARTTIDGIRVEVGRTGFTGELGYELSVAADHANEIWNAIERAGRPFAIVPAGEQAIDIARTEAGLVITGCDYAKAGSDPSGSHCRGARNSERLVSPYELNLGDLVHLSKPDFIGKTALAAERARGGGARRMLGLEIDWRAVVDLYVNQGMPPQLSSKVDWEGRDLYAEGRRTGWASSIVWSPTVRKLIAFAFVEREVADVGGMVQVDWTVKGGVSGRVPATLVSLPFIDIRRSS